MKASIDRDGCIGCGVCSSICPDVFEMDDENIATVKINPIPPDKEDDASSAAESCPVSVITIENE